MSAAEASAKTCWVLAVAIAVICYFAVVGPSEAHITDVEERTDALLARVLADEQTAKDMDRLGRLQHDISAELEGVNLGTDRAGVIAEFLRDVETRSRSRRVRLVSVQNELAVAGTGSRATSAGAQADPFEAATVDIVLEGQYGAVLRTIADFSRSRVLMKIQQSSIDRAKGQQDDRAPLLSAQLKLAIFYLRIAPPPDAYDPRAT